MDKETLVHPIACGHCANVSRMEIIGNVNDVVERPSTFPRYSIIYSVAICPACKGDNIVRYELNDGMKSDDDIHQQREIPAKAGHSGAPLRHHKAWLGVQLHAAEGQREGVRGVRADLHELQP